MGMKRSVYLSSGDLELLDELKSMRDKSISEIVCMGIRSEYAKEFSRVRISEGAYACMSKGRPDLLSCVRLEDGLTVVIAREDALCDGDGNPTEIGRLRTDLMSRVSDGQGSVGF